MKYTPEKTSLLLPVSLAFFLALLTKLFFFDIMIAEGHSMEPTIKEGSIILINKLAYGLQVPFFKKHLFRWAEPQVGDILVFIAPDNRFAVKRCVLTADTESQIMDRPPKGSILVLGDNSAESWDSRSYGPINIEKIYGKLMGKK